MPSQFSDQAASISVRRDECGNEIPTSDPTMHENATPGVGSANYDAKHYADDFSSYGDAVADKGQSPSKESVNVDNRAADRGPEN